MKTGFYGWWIVAASFSILFITVGVALYTPPVFLVALEQEFGWSRATISLGTSIAAAVSALLSPLVGGWIDRWGARRVMASGALLMGSGFSLLALMNSLWQLYVLNLIAAVGVTCVAWIPNQTLISNWFERKRGLAMGIALAGIGFGGLVMAPFAASLIASLGWRLTYAVLAGLILAIVVTLSLAVVRGKPADLGLRPDGEPPEESHPPADSSADAAVAGGARSGENAFTPGEAVRTRSFWIIAGCNFLTTFGGISIVVHLVALLSDAGFDERLAAWSLGLAIGMSVAGRLVFGLLADRFPKKWVMLAALLLHAVATLCLFRIGATGALLAFIPIFGIGLGGSAVLFPLLVGEYFGLRAYAQILGFVMLSAALGVAIGPVLTGRIYDVSGGYNPAFAIHLTGFLIASGMMALLGRPRPA